MKTAIETVLEQKTEKIMTKKEDMSNIDIYNLCILNRRYEIEQKRGNINGDRTHNNKRIR